jgi:hypothetical protein
MDLSICSKRKTTTKWNQNELYSQISQGVACLCKPVGYLDKIKSVLTRQVCHFNPQYLM